MGLKIVTGRTGTPHVSSNQIQAFNRSLLGDLAILDLGQHFDAVVRDANTIRIYDGCIVVQGIYAIIPHDEYEDILVEPVSVGNTRIDTIYLHYAKDMENDTESVEIDIAQGEEAVNNPVKPDIDAGGDTWEGTTDVRIPLYDVTLTSFETTITAYEYMDVYSPTISDLQKRIPETTVSGVKGNAESEYRSGNVNITSANIGLGNVDNTADLDKPVSTAQQSALDDKIDKVTGKGLSTNDYTNAEKQKNADNASAISDIQEDLSTSLTATGNPLTIESSESNLVECVAEVEAVQEGSGDPSPDNIRHIIGQTEVVIEDVGKNLFDKDTSVDGYRLASDGTLFAQSGYTTSDFIRVNSSTNYARNKTMNTNECVCLYDAFHTFISRITTGATFTTTSTTAYVKISMLTTDKDTTQLELGNIATTYEPYKGKTYTIQLGDTIYGGELDVLTGELIVTHGYIESYNGEPLPSTWISDRDEYSEGATPTIGAQVVYELATPYTIQLTPQQIRLLKGTNHLSCNTGDLSIKYYPDNVLGQLKGDIEKGLNAYYDYQIQALWDKIEELQA
jgi:hypothetical protein